MSAVTIERYHDISCGHRVAGHESKCAHLHGHNYRIHFTCRAARLDSVGRVLDFSAVKSRLCMWLEDKWDHKFLAWSEDKFMRLIERVPLGMGADTKQEIDLAQETAAMLSASVVWVPFNPTAENMAEYLLRVIAPIQLRDTGVTCVRVMIWETRKCAAGADLD